MNDRAITNELARHPGVFALFNEATGEVRTFVAPNTGLPSVEQLEAQRTQLLSMIDRAGRAERLKLKTRLDVLERDLRRARDAQEAERTNAERVRERANERGVAGTTAPLPAPTPSTNTSSLRDRIEALKTSIAALTARPIGEPIATSTPARHNTPTPTFRMKPGTEAGWARHLAEVDQSIAARMRATPGTTRT
jgi:hypothetical protein